jgi:ATP-dependent DNA helicase RecQ
MDTILSILKHYWGYNSFRPLQEDVIRSVLDGKDTLALMPTGGGKSLCYQVPALAGEGLCLVISPLIALMKDQVENLRKKGITAYAIYTGMQRKEVINILKVAGNSNCKFLYVSPERLETNLFKEYLPALQITLIAVDEAHCISQWGYDFRPSYLRIAQLKEELPDTPVLALTASATPDVQQDICDKLLFRQHKIFRQSFNRPNLSYSVFRIASRINKLVEILNNVGGSSIVYCRSRRGTQEIAQQLRSYHINADYYHAGLDADERSRRQEAWIKNNIRTIVCTNAFGMGIDKPDVRTVVHVDLPDCLENYYQEAGRAGRDGKKSYAVLLYQEHEPAELKNQLQLRFPPIDTIREVYQAIANYLQLPTGLGEGSYLDFDIIDFVKKFNLSIHTVLYVLKVLEQEGWIGFNEQVFLPARVQFVCNKERLYQFEEENAPLEPLIKTLLRSYEGIFDRETPIFEKQLSGWLKTDVAAIRKSLVELQRHHIISYQPQKDTPQLYLPQPRVKAELLSINQPGYEKRKKQAEQRTNDFIEYIQHTNGCRGQFIGRYFGDTEISACGICDNCLQQKKTSLSAEEFAAIRLRIEQHLDTAAIDSHELLQQMKDINKEKTWQVIEFLQSENRIFITKDGLLQKK